MRYFFVACSVIVVLSLIFAMTPQSGTADVCSKVVRLHIIANSDSEADQLLKLSVRDMVLDKFGSRLCGYNSKEDAEAKLSKLLIEAEETVNEFISEKGFSQSAVVTLSTEHYDEKKYEAVTLPAGDYSSLRIIIGDGVGQNWWCVLFPPLCLSGALGECRYSYDEETFVAAGFTPEEYKIITENEGKIYKPKFKIAELFTEIFG